ncbi:MAG: efflux RND transporter periplasmic adaptor subunit [Spirochaetaceae bacterium]|nr:efflux RND transporter periplasmic adaptor subunit [Spirochaetaceae bacterium]
MKQSGKRGGKISKTVTVIIAALILLFAGLTVYTVLRHREQAAAAMTPARGGSGGGQRPATAVRAVEVVLGTVENRVVINGDVLARSQVAIYPTVAGKLTELRFRVGDRVNRGAVVAMVDPSRPGEFYSQNPVVSTVSGTILQTPVNPGDTVSGQTVICVVGDLSALAVETFVPERFSTSVRPGLPAVVSFEAMPYENFAAVVDEVSPVLDPASRTLRIRLRFTPGASGRTDSRIKVGMFGTVSLVTDSRRNVPVIPRSAAINTYGNWIAFVIREDNTVERRFLTLGLEEEASLEVTEGLSTGERVVTAGQNFLSDGDTVRIVD